jgi:hypothetical protein
VDLPAGHVALSTTHLTTRDGHAYAFAEGRTAPGVSATTLVLDDGTRVTATTANGWFVAWWPGSHEVTAAEVTTPDGVTRQPFDSRHLAPCDQSAGATHQSAGATHGGCAGAREGTAGVSSSGGIIGTASADGRRGNPKLGVISGSSSSVTAGP